MEKGAHQCMSPKKMNEVSRDCGCFLSSQPWAQMSQNVKFYQDSVTKPTAPLTAVQRSEHSQEVALGLISHRNQNSQGSRSWFSDSDIHRTISKDKKWENIWLYQDRG